MRVRQCAFDRLNRMTPGETARVLQREGFDLTRPVRATFRPDIGAVVFEQDVPDGD